MEQSDFPQSVVIVGAGIFGLSTALAIARRHPTTRVAVVDRLTPPVEDGTSVETTRCIRAGSVLHFFFIKIDTIHGAEIRLYRYESSLTSIKIMPI